jgi:O-antigen ligase
LQGILGIDIIPNPKVTPSRLAELGIYIDIPSSTGFIRSHETLGVYINTASFLMMMGLFKEGRRIFGASLPVATISPFFVLLGLLLVQSRSTLVAFIIGLSVFVVLSLYSSDGKSKLSVLLTGLPVVTITGYTLMNNWESFVAINAEGVLARFEQARTALDLIASRPWWGYGFFANQEIFGHRHILHNTPLMIAVGIGLPGLILYLSLFATAAYSGLKCLGSDDWRAPMAIALLSALTASFAELNNYNGILNTGVYPIMGTLIALDNWNISYTTHKPKIKL